jgi:hypothetical protein
MKTNLLIAAVVMLAASLACSLPFRAPATPIPEPDVLPPTQAPIGPPPTMCPFIQNPGPPPADLIKRAQDAFAATGLPGELKVTGEGEYTCTEFHLRSVGFEFTVDIADLTDVGAMKDMAVKLEAYPVKDVLDGKNLDNIKLRFRAGDQFCWWDDTQGCGPVMPLLP